VNETQIARHGEEGRAGTLVERFLASRSAATARAYAADLEDFARSRGTSVEVAVMELLQNLETSRRQLLDYALRLRRRGLAPSTVRRRLGTLRSLLQLAREQGLIVWAAELPMEEVVEAVMTELAEQERSSYVFPRHPGEADRLDLQHHALREAVGRNYLAPIVSPRRVLDVGTGTGRWGIELCREHPGALVVGLDLVMRAGDHPSGYRYVQGNVLQGLPFQDNRFDFVHQRFLVSGIPLAEWPRVVTELVRVTCPGGWVELAEPMMPQPAGPATERLERMLLDKAASLGLDTTDVVYSSIHRYLIDAQLEEVVRHELTLPVGEWGGRVGSFLASDVRAGFARICEISQAQSLLSPEEARDLLRRSILEFEEYRTTWPLAIAYGRKP
jgi:SAM-dependent methyltransferase